MLSQDLIINKEQFLKYNLLYYQYFCGQNMREVRNIYFSGIGGSGVSAIACFMRDKGYNVSGSDRKFDKTPDHPLKMLMSKKGIKIFPQDGSGLSRDYDLFVYSTAVETENTEFKKAKELSIPLMSSADFLIDIANHYRSIAIAGTSGKSTTAGLLCFLMKRLGLEPNFIGGGRVRQFQGDTNPGNYLLGSSETLIIEACESDASITKYTPLQTVILNVSFDHRPVDETVKMFSALAENTKERVFINADDQYLRSITIKDTVTFSIYNPSEYHVEDVRVYGRGSAFRIKGIEFELSLLGEHNIYNALSCIALLKETGISLKEIAEVIPEFRGIERRFDIHRDDQYLVIDDYAHNPQKIRALMNTVSKMRDDVCYIFQPHGFAPTKLMKDAYIDTFVENLRDGDQVLFLPIYYSGGSVNRDISSDDLVEEIKKRGKNAEVLKDRERITEWFDRYQAFVVFGARDESLSEFASFIASVL